MQAYTIWVTPANAPQLPMLLDRCDEGKPLWFLSEKAALRWVREELFGEADQLPFSIEIKKVEVADLPKRSPKRSLEKIWEENKDFLQRNGVEHVSDHEGFNRAHCGYTDAIADDYCDGDGTHAENLARLEGIWREVEKVEEKQAFIK